MTITNDQIQALQALHDAAGPGKYSSEDPSPVMQYVVQICQAGPTLCAEVLALRAEVARMRKALKPLAEAAREYEDRMLPLHVLVYLGDLRRAQAELEGDE